MNYKNYNIEPGGLGYLYVHKDYEGVTFIGADIESSDPRHGSASTIEVCKEQIDEIEEEWAEKKRERTFKTTQP